jgi:hypothetical protein
LNDPWYIGTNIQVLINDGHGHFADETPTRLQSPPTQAKSWPQRVLLDDVNGDGRPDLTIQYAPEGVVTNADPTALYLNDAGVFRPATPPRDGYGREGGGIGWVNGAGASPALFSVEFHPLGEAPSQYYVTPQLLPPTVKTVRVRTGLRVSWAAVLGASQYELRRNGELVATTGATAYVDRRPGKHPAYAVVPLP